MCCGYWFLDQNKAKKLCTGGINVAIDSALDTTYCKISQYLLLHLTDLWVQKKEIPLSAQILTLKVAGASVTSARRHSSHAGTSAHRRNNSSPNVMTNAVQILRYRMIEACHADLPMCPYVLSCQGNMYFRVMYTVLQYNSIPT